MSDSSTVIAALTQVAEGFAVDTIARQKRTALDSADFEQLAAAGFLLTGVAAEHGGLWRGPAGSARDYATMVRTVAHGDPSVALVAAMHPAVTAFFLGVDRVEDNDAAWQQQKAWVEQCAATSWWGTVTSEPGSGGDIMQTRAVAEPSAEVLKEPSAEVPKEPAGEQYLLSGEKHFGSGAGHAQYMVTTARVEGSELPDLFFLENRDVPWDGSTGCLMTTAWEGIGMSATASHAFRFTRFPATRVASSEVLTRVATVSGQLTNMLFTGVVLGVADNALAFARGKLAGKQASMRAFEATEWVRCQNELWLAEQAFEGALRAIEAQDADAHLTALRCKICCAELVETALARMSKVVGGASFSRAMPLAQWTQDVKALGFLRPPLPLAYDQLMV